MDTWRVYSYKSWIESALCWSIVPTPTHPKIFITWYHHLKTGCDMLWHVVTKYQHLKPPASFTGFEHCLNLNWTSIDFSHVLHPPVTFDETHWTHVTHCQCRPLKSSYWLVVSTILKNMSSSMGRMTSHIYPYIMENKNHVWNHQPVPIYTPSKIAEPLSKSTPHHTTRPDASPSRPFFHDFGPGRIFWSRSGHSKSRRGIQWSPHCPAISPPGSTSAPRKKKASSANLPAVAINVAHFPSWSPACRFATYFPRSSPIWSCFHPPWTMDIPAGSLWRQHFSCIEQRLSNLLGDEEVAFGGEVQMIVEVP